MKTSELDLIEARLIDALCDAQHMTNSYGRKPREADVLLTDTHALIAEVRRLRAALESIDDDGECSSSYGPGCDELCKRTAYRALG